MLYLKKHINSVEAYDTQVECCFIDLFVKPFDLTVHIVNKGIR